MTVLHLATTPTGIAPWSPWATACGRTAYEDGLADDLLAVSCRACLRTAAGAEARAEQAACSLPPTPAATRATTPCDVLTGPTAVQLALDHHLPPQVVADLGARARLGRGKYGVVLRAPWEQGLDEALPELLDAIAYLMVSRRADALRLVRELVPLVQRLQRLSMGLPEWEPAPEGQ